MANIFDSQNLKATTPILGDVLAGWHFRFKSSDYDWVCEPWPDPTGFRHGYIYDWRHVLQIFRHRSYIMDATASVTRVSDNANIPAQSIDIGLDWNNWCWSLRFELLGYDNLQLIQPTNQGPVEVEVTINGWAWRFFIESWNEVYTFGRNTFTVNGRALICELDAPYQTEQDYYEENDISAHQLIENILQNTGWTVDWQATDWMIAGGAFSIRATPIRAILKITQAQDCVIFGDRTRRILHIWNRFPVSSWNIAGATPDAAIPAEATLTISQEYNPQTAYVGCRLRGISAGALEGFIRRAGTDGNPCLAQITDELFTDTRLLLERGRIELSKYAGAYYRSTIAVPLFPEGGQVGLLNLTDVIQYQIKNISYKGLVTAVRVNASRGEKGLKTGQIVEVLRWV